MRIPLLKIETLSPTVTQTSPTHPSYSGDSNNIPSPSEESWLAPELEDVCGIGELPSGCWWTSVTKLDSLWPALRVSSGDIDCLPEELLVRVLTEAKLTPRSFCFFLRLRRSTNVCEVPEEAVRERTSVSESSVNTELAYDISDEMEDRLVTELGRAGRDWNGSSRLVLLCFMVMVCRMECPNERPMVAVRLSPEVMMEVKGREPCCSRFLSEGEMFKISHLVNNYYYGGGVLWVIIINMSLGLQMYKQC